MYIDISDDGINDEILTYEQIEQMDGVFECVEEPELLFIVIIPEFVFSIKDDDKDNTFETFRTNKKDYEYYTFFKSHKTITFSNT